MPDTGPCAPARTLVAVRAMVPVTQKPPKSPEPTLATPCATSSVFERCRRPVMPSATTAESSDSIEPSSAKLKALGSTATTFGEARPRQRRRGEARRGCRRRRCRSSRRRARAPRRRRAASATTISIRGQCGRQRLQRDQRRDRRRATAPRSAGSASAAPARAPAASRGAAPAPGPASVEAEQRHELAREDDRGDAGGEADRHRVGDELDEGAEPRAGPPRPAARPRASSRGSARRSRAAATVAATSTMKAPGRPADLEPAAAERRDEEAADDRGVEPARRRHARGDGDRHRQRQRHDRHRQPGEQVGAQLRAARSPRRASSRASAGTRPRCPAVWSIMLRLETRRKMLPRILHGPRPGASRPQRRNLPVRPGPR